MWQLKNLMWRLKNWKCDKTKKIIKMWPNLKKKLNVTTQNVTTQKLKLWQNSKPKLWQNSNTPKVTKLKNSKCDNWKTQSEKLNIKCDKTKKKIIMWQLKT